MTEKLQLEYGYMRTYKTCKRRHILS